MDFILLILLEIFSVFYEVDERREARSFTVGCAIIVFGILGITILIVWLK